MGHLAQGSLLHQDGSPRAVQSAPLLPPQRLALCPLEAKLLAHFEADVAG